MSTSTSNQSSRKELHKKILAGVLDKTRQGNTAVSALPTVDQILHNYPEYGIWIDGWTHPQFAFDLFSFILALGNANHQSLLSNDDLSVVFSEILYLRSVGRYNGVADGQAAYKTGIVDKDRNTLSGIYRRNWHIAGRSGRCFCLHSLEIDERFTSGEWLSRVRILAHEARHALQFCEGRLSEQNYNPPHGQPVSDPYSPAELDSVLFQQTLYFILQQIEPNEKARMVRLVQLRKLSDEVTGYANTKPDATLLDNARVVSGRLAGLASHGSTFPLFRGYIACLAALVTFVAATRQADFVFHNHGDDRCRVEASLDDLNSVSVDHLAVPYMQSRLEEEKAYAHSRLFQLKRDEGTEPAGDLVAWLATSFSAAVLYPLPRKVKYFSSALRVLGENQESVKISDLADDLYCDLYAAKHLPTDGEAARLQLVNEVSDDQRDQRIVELANSVHHLFNTVICGATTTKGVLANCDKNRGSVTGFALDMFTAGAVICFREGDRIGLPGCPAVGRDALWAFENGCFMLLAANQGLQVEPSHEELLNPTEVRVLWHARPFVR